MLVEIKDPEITKAYTQKEIQSLFSDFVKKLKEEDNEDIDYWLYEIAEEDLTEEEKEALEDYRKNKDKIKFYNLKA